MMENISNKMTAIDGDGCGSESETQNDKTTTNSNSAESEKNQKAVPSPTEGSSSSTAADSDSGVGGIASRNDSNTKESEKEREGGGEGQGLGGGEREKGGGGAETGGEQGSISQAELKAPREHARLDTLLSQIPKKAQHGLLMQCDLILTCIDANSTYIALGSNIGTTFLFHRHTQTIQRLRSETTSDVITCVALHEGLDHQVAVGMASGTLCIFFIPGPVSKNKKQLQKFDVRSVHKHYISCLAWSTNGMKLFSGDKTGHVVITEVDFYQDQCKSSLLLVEPPTEIVQLSYDHRVLLVSTKDRSFICRLDTTGHTVQIGQQDRKVQGNFGAVLIPGLCQAKDARLYAVRPGCRIWLSDIDGNVLHTHIFKDLLMAGPDIPLLHPAPRARDSSADLQFGRLLLYAHGQLLTYNTSTLFILDPVRNHVVGSQSQLGGIVDLAVHADEVFVLRRHSDTAIVRIAPNPEAVTGMHMDPPASIPLVFSNRTASSSNPAVHQQDKEVEENKAKGFFKKTFFSPLKKLENFIEERTQAKEKETEPDLRPVIRSDPESDLRPLIRSDPDHTAPRTASTPFSDLPPVVPLDSPDLLVRVYKGSAGTPVDVQSPDSAHSALSVFAEEVGEKGQGKVTGCLEDGGRRAGEGDPVPVSMETVDQDIIFSHQMKKKAKKKKSKAKAEKDTDSISQSSFSSQGAGEDRKQEGSGGGGGVVVEQTDEVLRRAEEALSSVDRLLKNGGGKETSKVKNTDDSGAVVGEGPSPASLATEVVSTQGKSLPEQLTVSHMQNGSPGTVGFGAGQTLVVKNTAGHGSSTTTSTLPTMTVPGNRSPQVSASPVCHNTAVISASVMSAPDIPSQSTVVESTCSAAPPTTLSDTTVLPSARQGETDALQAAEQALDSMTQRFKKPFKQESMAEDFYNMFAAPYSPTESLESPLGLSSSPSLTKTDGSSGHHTIQQQISSGSESSIREITVQRIANNWSEFTAPANIYSLALSESHVWFTDKSDNLYYSTIGGVKGVVWRKVGEPASQIAVSPSGHIVWRVHKERAFAGTKITQRRPEGLKWVEAVNNVAYVSVDDTCAWYVKTSGEVLMQRALSKERPCFRSLAVETEGVKMKAVMARHGVLWALTDSMTLMVRTGISPETPQGLAWHSVTRRTEPYLFSSVGVDHEGIGWAVDVAGQIWFTDGVTPQNPVGSGKWWQVPLSEYFVQDPSVLDMIRTMARKRLDTQMLSHILSTRRGGLIATGSQGVWLSLDYLNTLYVCRGSLQGYQWSGAQPSKMAASTTWKQVTACATNLDWGMAWAQQVNGELYAIPRDSSDATLTPTPSPLVSISVNRHAVWGLTGEGELLVRTLMGPHCPLGVDWATLDLLQLGDVFLVHVSCNDNYMWVVDADGRVFHRIGAAAPKPGQLNPAWLPIDVYTEIVFTKVIIGPLDWMVWAVDNRRLTYVRLGVCEDLPLGKEWVHVPGIQALDLSVSGSGVWALNTTGEVLFRYGITPQNVSGNYWKKIPGCLTRISASSDDVLWAVNTSAQLVKCCSRLLLRRQDSMDVSPLHRSVSSNSEDAEWEMV